MNTQPLVYLLQFEGLRVPDDGEVFRIERYLFRTVKHVGTMVIAERWKSEVRT